ncbi:MAG: cyclic pyranopterin monophosphate synthase MoaC [Planctomycetes bacterium]|nr:cyclic pyranopterin monophosphate synthase MoaC [Planctomycetota bacterium]
MGELSHFDERGASRMVDVGDKTVTRRIARASGQVRMAAETLALLRDQNVAGTLRGPSPADGTRSVPATLGKGDVLEVARLAGIMAAKRTAELIPLCHPLPLESVTIYFSFDNERTLRIEAMVQVEAKTGVEMEALTAVSVAALTIYDMCKSVDRGMSIGPIQLEEKSGGRSGHWRRPAAD